MLVRRETLEGEFVIAYKKRGGVIIQQFIIIEIIARFHDRSNIFISRDRNFWLFNQRCSFIIDVFGNLGYEKLRLYEYALIGLIFNHGSSAL